MGLCEYVQHLSLFDFICVSGSLENGRYLPPTAPGYSIAMYRDSLDAHEFPAGAVWR